MLRWVLVLVTTASVISYFDYWRDKRAATAGRRRVPEAALHLIDAIGGWPGGLIAQRTLRHKTRKVSFQVVFWCTVVANLGAMAVLLLVFSR